MPKRKPAIDGAGQLLEHRKNLWISRQAHERIERLVVIERRRAVEVIRHAIDLGLDELEKRHQ